MAENTYNPFPERKRVFDLRSGFGKVTEVNLSELYPIKVLFDNGEQEYYDLDGKSYINDRIPMLYKEEMQVVPKK